MTRNDDALRLSDKFSALASGALDNATPEEAKLAQLKLGGRIVDRVLDAHIQQGVELSPLHELYYRESLRVFSESGPVEMRVRTLRALETNITRLVREHHSWRHAKNGNVVWEFCGPTGSGKSSSMLSLLERWNHVKPADLGKHLTIDVPDLPNLLPTLGAGSGVAIDEQTHAVGEGSVTQAKVLRNMEDQIRLSGVDIYWASPEAQDHATSQGQFVSLGTNFKEQYTRFLVYLNDIPLGYASLPWCSSAMWRAYEPIKRKNVDRAQRALFHNYNLVFDHIKRLFDVPAVQVATRVRRLKTTDWKRLLKQFLPTLSTTQVQAYAEEIEFMLETLATRPDEFETLYDFSPTSGMIDAAGGAPNTNRRT